MPTRDDLSEVSARSCVEESCAVGKARVYGDKICIVATIVVAIEEEDEEEEEEDDDDDDDSVIADSIQQEHCCAS